MTRVLSGIQPTGRFHWGNYFGAIRQYIDLQHEEQSYYFIANLHALTTIRDPKLPPATAPRVSMPASGIRLMVPFDTGMPSALIARPETRPVRTSCTLKSMPTTSALNPTVTGRASPGDPTPG